ncbi:hypothetical protein PM082_010862 [Marasmius tenuissimus]|nr:hypothetical protein PM082_010862 [Marasmius tenuissimus]
MLGNKTLMHLASILSDFVSKSPKKRPLGYLAYEHLIARNHIHPPSLTRLYMGYTYEDTYLLTVSRTNPHIRTPYRPTRALDNMTPSDLAQTTHGSVLIGFLGNGFLLGVLTIQCYNYFITYKRDRPWIKFYVVILYLLNVLNTGFIMAHLYEALITNFGNDERLLRADWYFATSPVLTGLIAMQVQMFFAWRVKVLTRSMWLGLFVASLGIAGLGGAVASTVGVLAHPAFVEFQVSLKDVVLVWLIGHVLADAAITVILVAYLASTRRD